jgi:hypothetical protein
LAGVAATACYFDVEACARSALGPYWLKATALQRQEFVELYEDYIAIGYSTALRALGGANFKVLASQPDKERVIVTKAAHRGLVRHRLAPEIDPDKAPQRQRIVQRLLYRWVRQLEPLLQEIEAQHPLHPDRRAAVARLRIERLDQCVRHDPPCPQATP